MQDLENNHGIILEFTWNNSDTFRVFIQNNTSHFLLEFTSNNTETFREALPNNQTRHIFWGMNPPSNPLHGIWGNWRILNWYIFRGLSFFEILGGAIF